MRSRPFYLVCAAAVTLMLACNLPFAQPDSTPEPAGRASPTRPKAADQIQSSATMRPSPTHPPEPTKEIEELDAVICDQAESSVAVFIQPELVKGIQESLNQYGHDLCADGYAVVLRISDFTTPAELRAHLAELYASTRPPLEGALLIGNPPHAYQWFTMTFTNPDIPPKSEEFISFQYYADLNGVFEASPVYSSPNGHAFSYDIHRGEVDWEIWIGVLPLYKGEVPATIEALKRYFAKNHAYRSGEYDLPSAFLEINEHFQANTIEEHNQTLSDMTSGQYAWTPFSNAPNARLYFNSQAGDLTVDQGYEDLSAGRANFFVLSAHGTWQKSGKLDIAWVESQPLRVAFFWSGGCSVGNLDHPENLLTSVLYSPTSMVVVAKGATNDTGGMGTNSEGFFGHNIASALSHGHNFGQAILRHVNVPLIYPWSESRELHFGTPVFLGDLTLKLSPHRPSD
jgi:hypothetical protein